MSMLAFLDGAGVELDLERREVTITLCSKLPHTRTYNIQWNRCVTIIVTLYVDPLSSLSNYYIE